MNYYELLRVVRNAYEVLRLFIGSYQEAKTSYGFLETSRGSIDIRQKASFDPARAKNATRPSRHRGKATTCESISSQAESKEVLGSPRKSGERVGSLISLIEQVVKS